MDFILNLLVKTLLQVWTTFVHNWPFLVVSILIAVALNLYLDSNKVGGFLLRHRRAGVVGATLAAVLTPLCSCGTTAVILGMMAGMLPWAPIIAFMVASPLTSPGELVYSAGLFGWPFALAFFISSILLGLIGGAVASFVENRGWLKNQARYTAPTPVSIPVTADAEPKSAGACGCSAAPAPVPAPAVTGCSCGQAEPTLPRTLSNLRRPSRLVLPDAAGYLAASPALQLAPEPCECDGAAAVAVPAPACGCGAPAAAAKPAPRVTPEIFLREAFQITRRLLPMFIGFAFIGYFLNNLIPQAWVTAVFGSGNVYSVPLAATLGLPLYINTEASLPLVRALIEGGMSQGAALAFLITGAGTSVGAITGAFTIARWRVIGVVVGVLWVGAVAMGFLYNLLLATGLV